MGGWLHGEPIAVAGSGCLPQPTSAETCCHQVPPQQVFSHASLPPPPSMLCALCCGADQAESMVHDLSLQHCTNIIWAYASISWSTPTLMPTLVAGESGLWGGWGGRVGAGLCGAARCGWPGFGCSEADRLAGWLAGWLGFRRLAYSLPTVLPPTPALPPPIPLSHCCRGQGAPAGDAVQPAAAVQPAVVAGHRAAVRPTGLGPMHRAGAVQTQCGPQLCVACWLHPACLPSCPPPPSSSPAAASPALPCPACSWGRLRCRTERCRLRR